MTVLRSGWSGGLRRYIAVIAGVLLVAFGIITAESRSAAAASAKGKAAAGGEYALGADADLTGGDDVAGGLQTDGIRAAFAAINAAGGVNGHKIQLTVKDDAGEASNAISNVRLLAEQDHVSALVGTMDSTVATALIPLVSKLDVPLLGTTIPGNLAAEELPYVYETIPTDTLIGNALLSEIAKLKTADKLGAHPRVVVSAFAVPSGEAWLAQASSFAKKLGLDIVGKITAPLQPTNEDAEAAKIAALHPAAIAAEDTQTEMQELAEGLTAAGVSKTLPIVMSWFSSGSALMSSYHWPGALGLAVTNVVSTKSDSKALAVYKHAAAAAHQQWSNPNFAQGYVVAEITAQALQVCGYPCSGQQLNRALTKVHTTLNGLLLAPASLSSAEHTAMKYVRFYKVGASGKVTYVGPLVDTVWAGLGKY